VTKRLYLFVCVAVCVAVVFIRLGFWQLHRLEQRRRRNALVAARIAEPVAALTALPADSTSRLRRARVTGRPDYEHELVLAPRSFEGSPGVNLVTPLHIPGRDTAVLVNRGWAYAPDGLTVDRSRWHERDSTFVGYAEIAAAEEGTAGSAVLRDDPHLLRRLDYAAASRALPYPVSPVYLVATEPDSATPADARLARLPPPTIDEGPHLGYAVQWFSFAAIALVGAGVVVGRALAAERAREGNGRLAPW
jgi:surfeit locus 1 family protein